LFANAGLVFSFSWASCFFLELVRQGKDLSNNKCPVSTLQQRWNFCRRLVLTTNNVNWQSRSYPYSIITCN
jgi:hypothetical protein